LVLLEDGVHGLGTPVITGLSWCRPEQTVKHVPLRATNCPLMAPFYDGVCQGAWPRLLEGAAALVGVNVVRPVGR
jgi:hypothetical protein